MFGLLLTADANSIGGLLEMATQLLTWFLSSMGSLVTFIIGHPIILIGFLIFLVGAVVAMFVRIWKSA